MHMDLSEPNNLIGESNPVQMPVSELLSDKYHFTIPSYQRGYRWESGSGCQPKDNEPKQVDDLLNDLLKFVKENQSSASANYYLQPLMVKPKKNDNGLWEWEVLDGQQRLTTMLLILKCLNERLCNGKYSPYTIRYEIRQGLDLGKITYDEESPNYDYPSLKDNQDCYYIRKAKNRIKEWYDNEIANNQPILDSLKAALFYPDSSRGDQYPTPKLRAIFIWYNVEPSASTTQSQSNTRLEDIAVFNRLNRGKISLTDSELIKALFILNLKKYDTNRGSSLNADTLVRKWDEMGRKFQDDSLWETISPKGKEYQNRLDLLFDFIRECDEESKTVSSYRYYHNKLNAQGIDIQKLEEIWEEIKRHFDKICKWHEDVSCHNFIGYLVACGKSISDINKGIIDGIKNNRSTIDTLKEMAKNTLNANNKSLIDNIDDLNYREHYDAIKKTLLLFNVLTCDKHGQKFPFDCYNKHQYDIEHINSQTDNPIEKIDEKIEWINSQALLCLSEEKEDKEAEELSRKGKELLERLEKNGEDKGNEFKVYRTEVEEYYAGNNGNANRDSIGNLTLLNSSINREYKNALYPSKLKTLKLCDQEGLYIPLCTKYLFMKYYTNTSNTTSVFNMTRWREEDQEDYMEAIRFTLKNALS